MVHNRYQQSGGEEQVVEHESNLLESYGEEVLAYMATNDKIQSTIKDKLSVGVNAVWSYPEYKKFKLFLQTNKPDVVHVHNFFPIISPSLYYACQRLKVPIVQTLHNYRLICPAATFLRNGDICEKCLNGTLLNSIRYSCYRNSAIQTVPVAAMIGVNRALHTWKSKVNQYIALTEFAKGKFIESGIPEEKITVKPNFLSRTSEGKGLAERGNYLLFVGRISKEKGLDILLAAWEKLGSFTGAKLIIIGDGPERVKLENEYTGRSDVVFKGKLPSAETMDYMMKARFLVVPSIWYEGMPMTILEAYSVGTPVIASDVGSLQEVVRDKNTGFLFTKGDNQSLLAVLKKAMDYEEYDQLVRNAENEFKEKYTSEINYQQLTDIYKEAINKMQLV